ncbi:MAG: FAD:protein FMN transferase [Candidatus Margulisiibacteriota bacterium]
MNPKRLVTFILITAAVATIMYFVGQKISSTQSLEIMSTTLTIQVHDRHPSRHINEAFDLARRIDALLSRFNPKSDVSLINHFAGVSAIEVSPETLEAIQLSIEMSRLTGGAFDITKKDYSLINTDASLKRVKLISEEAEIDLGGIGKGYAVEKIYALLKERGVKKALIDMHSSLAAIGGPWRIGIQDPNDKEKLVGTVELHDGQALSTSGNYERGDHIVNPKDKTQSSKCRSVTVLCKDAAVADALSTAVFVLGPEKGLELINSLDNTECLIVQNDGKIVKTKGFILL